MSDGDQGHAIGVPGEQPFEPSGREQDQPPTRDELQLGTAHAHARAMAELGDLTGARTTIEDALALGELRLGPLHPALVPLMVDLATIARRLGNVTEARNQLRRAHAVVVTHGGQDHPTALSLEGRIAAVGFRLGEPTDVHDRHLADTGVRVLGAEHPAIRAALQRLGQTRPGPTRPAAVPVIADPAPVSPQLPVPMQASPYGPALEGDIWPAAPADEPTVRAPRRAGGGLALVLSLSAVVLIAGTVVALQLFSPGGGPTAPGPVTGQSPEPAPTSPAPAGIDLTDRGDMVTLTWVDPSDGAVPFVVSGAIQGSELTVLESVPAGRTSATIYGTNPNVEYCFTVAAVWSAELVRESDRTCTQRGRANASAS